MAKEKEELEFNDNVTFFGENEIADPSEIAFKAFEEAKDEVIDEEEEVEEEVTTLTPPDKKDKKEVKKAEDKDDEDDDSDFFAIEKKKDDPVNIKNEGAGASPTIAGFNFLKEKGFIDFELEEGEELTDELAEELIEEKWEASIDEAIKEMTDALPREGKDFLKFVSKGGDPRKFLAMLAKKDVDVFSPDTDIEAEDNQVKVVTADLEAQGYDSEYIEVHVQTLKDTGKLPSVSKKIFDKKIAEQDKQSEALAESQADAVKQAKLRQKNFNIEINNYVKSLEGVKGYKLTAEDKRELADFASKPTVTLKDGRVISGLQAGIYTAMADKEQLILLSKIVKSGFDLSFVEKAGVTKNTQQVRKSLANFDKNKAPQNTNKKRDLIDILGDDE